VCPKHKRVILAVNSVIVFLLKQNAIHIAMPVPTKAIDENIDGTGEHEMTT